MKLPTYLLIILTFSIIATAQAQSLEYPKYKDYCAKGEGAKAQPDDLYSWCNDSQDNYYNACDCAFEKAMKKYNEAKKKIENQIENMVLPRI